MSLAITILALTYIIVGVLAFFGGRLYESDKQLREMMSNERDYTRFKK